MNEVTRWLQTIQNFFGAPVLTLGNTPLSLWSIIQFITLLALLFAAAGRLQTWLVNRLLVRSRLDTGARQAIGVDVSPINIQSARQRVQAAQLDHIEFQEGSVLALPFAENSFDIVFSNGVLHHTVDWRTGLQEALRVLKPGGWGWLYLIEKPGGLYWTIIEVLRALMQQERHETARRALQLLWLPDNRIFYMLDHIMAPVNERLTAKEISAQLAAAGATHIRRLTRGTDFDRNERLWRQEPFASLNFGVGEQRFVFSKS